MLPVFISFTTSGAALWRAVQEKAESLIRTMRDAWLALPGCDLMETILKRLDFTDEHMRYLDWTDDYWHMPRFPYDAEDPAPGDQVVSPPRPWDAINRVPTPP